jgi:ketosteroid isomerase-like protein
MTGYLNAMSRENVEIVRRMWAASLGDDPVSALSFYDPDVEWDGTNLPDGKIARGHEAIVDHLLRWAEMWDDWTVEPEQFIDAGGDQVIVVFRETGRSDSGLHMDERHAEFYRLHGSKIIYRKGFSDPDEALGGGGTSG